MTSATCVYHTILRGVNKLNIRYGSGVPVPCDPKWTTKQERIQIAESITPTAHLMNSSLTRSSNIFKTKMNQGSVTWPVPVHPDGWERGPSRKGRASFFFYLTRPLLLGEAPPLPRLPLLRRGLQPVNRLFCTRKQALAHKGLLVVIDAIELRLFYARCAIVLRNRVAIVLRTICECLTHDVRSFMRRWRPFGWVIDDKIGGI